MMSRMNKNFKQAKPVKPEPKPKPFSTYLKIAIGVVAAAILAAFFMV